MKLTKEQAIDYSIELWGNLAKTGNRKESWSEWKRFGGLDKERDCPEVDCLCFLCEYGEQERGEEEDKCDFCPYNEEFEWCCNAETPFGQWMDARTKKERRKYAAEFSAQLKQLKEDL